LRELREQGWLESEGRGRYRITNTAALQALAARESAE
jgi:hypothetical protein